MQIKGFQLILHWLWKIKFRIVTWLGGKTVGARALVLRDDEILLVRHTYCKGWYTIGGTVETGESPVQSLIRELKEEAGVVALEHPLLLGVYYSNAEHRDDYVLVYILREFTISKSFCNEIAEKKWFSLSNLPIDVSPATKRRIEEHIGIRVQTELW